MTTRPGFPFLIETRKLSSNPPVTGNKVQNIARKYSLLAKQAAGDGNYVPRNNVEKQPIITGAVKPKVAVATAAAATAAASVTKIPEVTQEKLEEETVALASPVDVEQEIETSLQVSDLTNKVEEIEIAPKEEEKKVEEVAAPVVVEEPIVEEPLVEEPIHEEPVVETKEQEQEAVVAEVVKAAEAEVPAAVEEVKAVAEAPVAVAVAVEEEKKEEEAPVVVEAAKQDTQSIEEEEIKNAPIEA
ncbi:hypothetical protein BGZ96_011456 [Linnemannia gamsii]|uniref:Uncharacterized protein n=1 Tax=Linnemannia gamsii TaxID=64522 RepID=A0ABQ7JS74_9FUNG|nr:hypothetical protein BGZ96_011456 [Linnemannia gamsii]